MREQLWVVRGSSMNDREMELEDLITSRSGEGMNLAMPARH